VWGSNSLWVESAPGLADFQPVEACYGQVLRFYGNRCAHMTVPNSSGVARVSFDFRVLPAALAVQLPEGAPIIVSNHKLEAGGYYYLLRCAQDPQPPLASRGPSAAPPRSEVATKSATQERPRACTCKLCGVERDRDDFSARQWRHTQPTCRACRPAGRCTDGRWPGQASTSEAEVALATQPCSSTMGLDA